MKEMEAERNAVQLKVASNKDSVILRDSDGNKIIEMVFYDGQWIRGKFFG